MTSRAPDFLTAQGEIVELIGAGGFLADTLARIATVIERVVVHARCSILLLDEDRQRLRHGAAPSLPERFNRAVDGLTISPWVGFCGTAAYRREPIVVREIATDPRWAEVRHLALALGLRACWSQPIIGDGEVVLGAFALYYADPRQLEATDWRVIEAMARLVRLALLQHQKEKALRESEMRYRLLAEHASDVIIRLVIGGERLYVSPSVTGMLGYDPEELVGGNALTLVHPDDAEDTRATLRSLVPDGPPVTTIHRIRRKDGGYVWAEFVARQVTAVTGRLEIIGVIRDITARQAAEERLQGAKQRAEAAEQRAKQVQMRLVEAIEALSEGFALFDAEDRLVLCNHQYRALYPKSRGAIVPGARFLDILREGVRRGEYEAATDRPDEWIAERLALHARPVAVFEQHLTDGRWLRVQEHRLPDGGSIGVRIDVTDLKDREASFKLLFDGNPVPMWVFDRETLRFLEVNQAALEHYGYSRAQFLTMTIADIRPPEDVERLRGTLQNEGASRTFRRTWRHRRADGSLIEVDIMGHLLEFQGRPAQLTAAFDVTERNRTAAALQAAKREAEAASRTKSQFLATMSHELRTPLNAILGFSEIIRDARMGPVGHRYRDYARDIHGSGQHLLGLINDILDLSKIEVGRLELYEEHLDVAEIIKSCCHLVAERAHTGDVRLEVRISKDLPPVSADRLRLKQVLLNLLSNAVKFTLSGGRVSVAATAPTGGGVEIRVADTGIGMRQEDIPIAFEPFRQIDSSQSRRYEGTGLGLPLAKRLVELHGGTLEVESELGRGTTVRVRLPKSRVLRGADRSEAETGI